MQLANGEVISIRDDVGLVLDPAVWANPKCKVCYGRGTFMQSIPMTKKQIAELSAMNPQMLSQVRVTDQKNGSGLRRTLGTCGCGRMKYMRVRSEIREKQYSEKTTEEALLPSG